MHDAGQDGRGSRGLPASSQPGPQQQRGQGKVSIQELSGNGIVSTKCPGRLHLLVNKVKLRRLQS